MKGSLWQRIEGVLVRGEQQVLGFLLRWTTSLPGAVLLFSLAVAALAAFYTAGNLEFVTGRIEMISIKKRYVQLDEEYSREFKGLDPMIVAVEPRDVEQGKRFVARLGEILEQDTAHVEEVFYRIDTSSLEGRKLLYLSPEELRDLRDNLEDNRDLVRDLTAEPGLNNLFEAVNRQVSSGMVSYLMKGLLGVEDLEDGEGEEGGKKPVKIDFLNSLLREMERAIGDPDYGFRSPWSDFFGGKEELTDEGFLVSGNRRFVFLMVEPKETGENGFTARRDSIAAIQRAVADLRAEFPGLEAGVTGQKALNNDEMLSAQNDTSLATVVSFAGITLLYLVFFRNLRHPLIIAATLLLGLAWTMGFITLTVGHLTIITVFVAPMLLGLADDFAVHFMTRYEEERAAGRDARTALGIVFEHTAPGIVAGALTTSLAFFAVMLTDFRGVQELGFITGCGLILYLLITLTFLPSLILLVEKVRPWKETRGGRTFLAGLFRGFGSTMARARRPLLVVAALATAASLLALPGLRFDYNLLNLQARGTESVVWEKRILENSQRSSWKAVTAAPTLEEAVRKARAFEALPAVDSVESVASLLPADQETRLPLVRALPPLLAGLPEAVGAPEAVDLRGLRRTLEKLKFKLRKESDQWDPDKKPGEAELEEARVRLAALSDRLQNLPAEGAGAALEALEGFQRSLFVDFQDKWNLLRRNLDPPGPVTLEQVPQQIKDRLISRDGSKYLLQIYARENIWDREPLEEFIRQLRSVDPDVAGSPVVGYESIHAMKMGYSEAGLYALVAVLAVTFLALRRFGDTLFAVIPLALGMVWTAGWMWLVNLPFNLANLIVVPLIIGIGLENGIHIVHRWREEGEGGPELVASSTGQSVALFSLTTMVGFGSLMVAKYYGIFSIGLLLTVSVGSVLAASLSVLPLILFRAAGKRPD